MTDPDRFVADLRQQFQALADPARAEGARRYFKEPITLYGLPSGEARRRAMAARREVRASGGLPLALEIADLLYPSGNMEEAAFAEILLQGFARHFEPAHFDRFDPWLDLVNNWANTDGLSRYTFGQLFLRHPPPLERLLAWTRSPNRWRRRAAAVTLTVPGKKGLHHPTAYQVADRLLGDRDKMVQKGVGWLLKEMSHADPEAVAAYLVRNREKTSRLVLRYASEKLPEKLRTRVLA